MVKAVIDIGTNTFNLLIADFQEDEQNFSEILSLRKPVLMGMGGINQCMLSQEAMHRAMRALQEFKKRCDDFGVERMYSFGTSVMRNAKNAEEFVARARDTLGIQIQIISGEREARMVYDGIKFADNFEEEGVIMDIGGGSTEFIRANHEGIVAWESIEIGVSRIYQQLGKPTEYLEEHRHHIQQFFERQSGNFMSKNRVKRLIGASGSFETFFEMIYQKEFEKKSKLTELPLRSLKEILHWTISSSFQERKMHPRILPMRKEMLPIVAMKILWAINQLGVETVYVSPYALKEGGLCV